MGTEPTHVVCSNCGRERSLPGVNTSGEITPCPQCGATAVRTESLTGVVTPLEEPPREP